MTTKLKPPGMWLDGEDGFLLRAMRTNRPLEEAATELNRPLKSVETRAEILRRMTAR